METAIRLHRAGEGAGFTGLKPAGIDYGPMIPAAERSLETGDLQSIKSVLIEEIDHVLGERLFIFVSCARCPATRQLQ